MVMKTYQVGIVMDKVQKGISSTVFPTIHFTVITAYLTQPGAYQKGSLRSSCGEKRRMIIDDESPSLRKSKGSTGFRQG